jgi:hypothetical protein
MTEMGGDAHALCPLTPPLRVLSGYEVATLTPNADGTVALSAASHRPTVGVPDAVLLSGKWVSVSLCGSKQLQCVLLMLLLLLLLMLLRTAITADVTAYRCYCVLLVPLLLLVGCPDGKVVACVCGITAFTAVAGRGALLSTRLHVLKAASPVLFQQLPLVVTVATVSAVWTYDARGN